MINRRAAAFSQLRGNTPRAGEMPRFRPIAPKPASAAVTNHTSALVAPPSINPCSKSSRKRSHPNASGAGSPQSKRTRCSGARPLIPVNKPSSKTLHFTDHVRSQQQPELRTLALLPDAPAAERSASPPSSCQTSCSEDEEWSPLTELSLATSTSSDQSPASSTSASECSWEEEEAAAPPRPAAAPCIEASAEVFEQLYASSSEAMVLSNSRGAILWCNHVYRVSVSRGEDLGLPIPINSCGFGTILWMFSRRTISSGLLSMNLCSSGPLRPQAVRASTVTQK